MGLLSGIGDLFGISDAATGGLVSGGLGLVGGLLTNQATAQRADQSNDWSAEQYGKRYQTMVSDLKAAGLNPMLAYSQSPGSAPSAQQVQFQNPVSSAFQGYESVRGTEASATRDYSSAGQAEAMSSQADANTEKIKEEIKNVPREGQRLYEAAKMLYEQANLMSSQSKTQQFQQKVLLETVENLKKDGFLKQLDIDAAKKFDNFAREYKQYAPIIDLMKAILLPRSGGVTINK